jgi:8-oxo-dGTP diphosphatase
VPDTIAIVALVEGGRLLLGHRHPSRRWYPDCWDLVGGHLEPGESPEQAARRECREEIAVDVLDLHPIELDIDDRALVAHAFLTRTWTGRPINAAPDEHDAIRWFTHAELPGLRLAHPSYLDRLTDLLEQEAAFNRTGPGQ